MSSLLVLQTAREAPFAGTRPRSSDERKTRTGVPVGGVDHLVLGRRRATSSQRILWLGLSRLLLLIVLLFFLELLLLMMTPCCCDERPCADVFVLAGSIDTGDDPVAYPARSSPATSSPAPSPWSEERAGVRRPRASGLRTGIAPKVTSAHEIDPCRCRHVHRCHELGCGDPPRAADART